MDQKFPFGGLIGYGNSYLDSLLCYSKVFRLHAILHDAAGAVRSHTGKGPGYCYMIGQGRNSCLLNDVTGLLFCLQVKLFLPSIFKSDDFWNSMSCIVVLVIELAEKNINKQFGILNNGKVQGCYFDLQKSKNLQSKHFGVQKTCMELFGTVEVWITVSCQTFFLEL